jgi:hypothetical protein
MPYLLACLIQHREWLKQNLHQNHPLFRQRVWTSGIMSTVEGRILSGVEARKKSKMKATGIPPHVTIQSKLKDVEHSITLLQQKVQELLGKLPNELTQEMLSHFQINGAVPITSQQFTTMIEQLETRLKERDAILLRQVQTPQVTVNESPASGSNRLWTWGGGLHPVPEGFEFPTANLNTLWHLWFGGIPAQQIGPLKSLKCTDLKKKDKSRLAKARQVIEKLVAQLPAANRTGLTSLTAASRDQLYEQAFRSFFEVICGGQSMASRNYGDHSYLTWYDKIRIQERGTVS